MRQPPECWQYCQNWPIRGYSSSCYTRRGSLKKFLQALTPLLALVLPRFFLAPFRPSPTTESLEQANVTLQWNRHHTLANTWTGVEARKGRWLCWPTLLKSLLQIEALPIQCILVRWKRGSLTAQSIVVRWKRGSTTAQRTVLPLKARLKTTSISQFFPTFLLKLDYELLFRSLR